MAIKTVDRKMLLWIDVLLGSVVAGLYFGLRFCDVIQWDFEQIPEGANSGTGSITFGIFFVLFTVPIIGIHTYFAKKRSGGLSGTEWVRYYLKTESGYLGVFIFLSFLLIANIDPYLAYLTSKNASESSVEIVYEYGQPQTYAQSDIQDLIGPSYFAFFKNGVERSKIGICKPVWNQIRAGRKAITLIRSQSFHMPIIKVKCD